MVPWLHMGWWFFIIKGCGFATFDEPFLAFPRSTWCQWKQWGLNHWIVLVNQVAGIALPELGSTTYVPGILYLLLALDRLFLKNPHTHLSPRKKRVVNKIITPLQEWPPKIPHANLLAARPRGSSGVRPRICPLQPSQLDSSLGRPNKPSPRNPHAHWPTVEKQWHHGCLVDAQDLGKSWKHLCQIIHKTPFNA